MSLNIGRWLRRMLSFAALPATFALSADVPEKDSAACDDPLRGKRLYFLGSSVTYGSAAGGVSFVEYIAQRNGCTYVKEAVSGTTLVDNGETSYVQRMKTLLDLPDKCDYFICQLSTNDASQGLPLGVVSDACALDAFDTSTIIGAMEYIICRAKQVWGCPVAFYTNTYYRSDAYQAMVDALFALQKKWGIGVINLWSSDEMLNVTQEQRAVYMADDIHPTAEGYLKWWTPFFECWFKEQAAR